MPHRLKKKNVVFGWPPCQVTTVAMTEVAIAPTPPTPAKQAS